MESSLGLNIHEILRKNMEIHVYDTYVKAADGHTMHFDVITGEKNHGSKPLEYGKEWLKEIGEGEAQMTQNECTFCHSQSCPEPVEQAIKETDISFKRWKAVLKHFFLF